MPHTSNSAQMERKMSCDVTCCHMMSCDILSAVLTFLSVANALQVFKIAKQKGGLAVSEPTVDFPKVS